MSESVASLTLLLEQHAPWVGLTGAGISSASGIPTYRDHRGRWLGSQPIQHQEFVEQAARRQRYWARSILGWPRVHQARPNQTPHKSVDDTRLKKPVLVYSLTALIGFYGGVIHIGIGLLIMAVLTRVGGLNLKYTNMHKMLMVIPYTLFAIMIFSFYHEIAWMAGLMLAVGASVGGWLGAKIAVEKSERRIRMIFKACIGAMIINLLFFSTI